MTIRRREVEGGYEGPPEDAAALVSLSDLFYEFRHHYETDSRVVMVPREFKERVEETYAANGIPTTPTLMMNGKKILSVERMGR